MSSEISEPPIPPPNPSDTDSINIDELVAKFLANKRHTLETAETNSIGECSLSETDGGVGEGVSIVYPKFEDKVSRKVRTIHDHFQAKLMSHLVKEPRGKSKEKAKKTTYHSRLLASGLDMGINGKMIQYTDYHAYNSDDSSDISDTFESSLFYRYGMASRFVDSSLKQDLICSRNTKKKQNFLGRSKEAEEERYRVYQLTDTVCCEMFNRLFNSFSNSMSFLDIKNLIKIVQS